MKKTIPFKIASRRTTNLGINLTKGMLNLYCKNYKTLLKGIDEDLNKQKDISRSETGRLDIVETAVLPKVIYMFSTNLSKIPLGFFAEMDKLSLKLM